jgi:hypothetical protein
MFPGTTTEDLTVIVKCVERDAGLTLPETRKGAVSVLEKTAGQVQQGLGASRYWKCPVSLDDLGARAEDEGGDQMLRARKLTAPSLALEHLWMPAACGAG